MSNRYLLFAGEGYYPKAGLLDFRGGYDSIAEAEAHGRRCIEKDEWRSPDWYRVIDTETMTVVAQKGYAYGDDDWP